MDSSIRIAFAAAAFAWMAGSLSGKSRKEVALEQTLSIYLYNDAEVSPPTLRWATVEATRLFRAAGIQINWKQYSTEAQQSTGAGIAGAACPETNEQRYIAMRLLRRAPTTASPGALGATRLFTEGGSQILIYFDHLEALRRSMNTEGYIILGHVMAHEIGHVLLHSTEHSAGGLMQAHLSSLSWDLASEGLLTFLPEEAERMNAGLAESRNGARSAGVGITCSNAYRKTRP